MPFLIALAVIIFIFCAILSIKLTLTVDYDKIWSLKVKWLFLKFDLLPLVQKEKKPKQEAPKEEAPAEEPKEPKPKKPKNPNNPFKNFYNNKGIDGIVELINNTMSSLGGFFGRILRKLKIDELFLDVLVSGDDAAETAINYGKRCTEIFPALGYIYSSMRVGKYNVNVYPDFLAKKDEAEFHSVVSIRPLALTNSVVILLGALIRRVAIKFLLGIKKPKAESDNSSPAASQPDSQSNI